tara:strand:- start:5 stop:241 length:237 start_codon:yes stop_codon:yes gene_type:complete
MIVTRQIGQNNGLEYIMRKIMSSTGSISFELFCHDRDIEVSVNLNDFRPSISFDPNTTTPNDLLMVSDFLKFISENYV